MTSPLFSRLRLHSNRYARALAAGGGAPTPTPTPTPTVSISSAQSKAEGNSGTVTWTYVISRSSAVGAVTVNVNFSAGGTNAADWQGGVLPSGLSVNMANGVSSANLVLTTVGDVDVEGNETFTLQLVAPSGYALGSPNSATGTITNDDVEVVPLEKNIAFDGDSLWQTAFGSSKRWAALTENADATVSDQSTGGSSVTSGNWVGGAGTAGGMIPGRIAALVANSPAVVIGAWAVNDLQNGDGSGTKAAEILDDVEAWVAAVRLANPNADAVYGYKTAVPEAAGITGYANYEAERLIFNAGLLAAVGDWLDFIVPTGEHPVIGPIAATANPAYYDVGDVHPKNAQQVIDLTILQAVIDPLFEGASGTTPDDTAFSFTPLNNVAVSTQFDALTVAPITGLGMGQTASIARSGSGTFAIGTGAFSAGSKTAMNGFVPVARVTSSADPETPVTQTLTSGASTAVLTVTTAAAVSADAAPLGKRSQSYGFGTATATFTYASFAGGRLYFELDNNANRTYTSVTASVDGGDPVDCHLVEFVNGGGAINNATSFVSEEELPAGTSLVITAVGDAAYGTIDCRAVIVSGTASGTPTDSAQLGVAFRFDTPNGGNHSATTAVDVDSGGIGLMFAFAENGVVTWPSGTTAVQDYGDGWYAAKFATSRTPSFNVDETVDDTLYSAIMAVSLT